MLQAFVKFSAKSFIITLLVLFSNNTNAQLVTGEYVGDGSATQAISGLGITPSVLLVIPATGGAAGGEIQTWIHTSSMAAGYVKFTTGGDVIANAFKTDFISSLDADGFTVASKSNVSGTTYYYVAWSTADGGVTVGTLTGATTDVSVVTGYEPAMVWLFSDNTRSPDYMKWTVSARPSGTYRFSHGEGGYNEYTFKAFSPIGFQVNKSTYSGSGILAGSTYHYVAFQGTIQIANPGWGAGPDKITTGYQPAFIMTRHSSTAGNNTYIKTKEMPTNDSFIPRHEVATQDAIRNFQSDGYDTGNTGQLRDKHYYFGAEALSALPVELVRFSGEEIDGKTELYWSTNAEINNNYFEVYGSFDGINWDLLSNVAGAGNSDVRLDYSVDLGYDNHLYYRLKQVDYDGSSDFSNVIVVKRDKTTSAKVTVYPNPAMNTLNITSEQFEAGIYTAKVIDIKGALVRESTQDLNENIVSFSIEGLPQGIYSVVLTNDSGVMVSQRFVKQ